MWKIQINLKKTSLWYIPIYHLYTRKKIKRLRTMESLLYHFHIKLWTVGGPHHICIFTKSQKHIKFHLILSNDLFAFPTHPLNHTELYYAHLIAISFVYALYTLWFQWFRYWIAHSNASCGATAYTKSCICGHTQIMIWLFLCFNNKPRFRQTKQEQPLFLLVCIYYSSYWDLLTISVFGSL